MRGKFITVEGTEGVGKTTNIELIRKLINERGVELVSTREPGGTFLAEEIREMLLAKREEQVNPTAELLLVFAARAQHIQEVIEPALARGAWVLSDRFTDATFAYQGYGRGLSLDTISLLEGLVQGELQPDITILLDIDVELGLERARSRAELDRFESEALSFFERVRTGYLSRAKSQPERFRLVDAGQSLEKVQADITELFSRL
ncbi:MAG: dTMP kinase [Flavobacteriales bacterium]|jgi:dTMP kinase